MCKQTLQTMAIQKTLGLSEQDALKVLIFITGMDAGKALQSSTEKAEKENGSVKFSLNDGKAIS